MYLLYTTEILTVFENNIYGYADGFTFFAVVLSPDDRGAATESLNSDLRMVSQWCALGGIKLKESSSKVVSGSSTMQPESFPFTLSGRRSLIT